MVFEKSVAAYVLACNNLPHWYHVMMLDHFLRQSNHHHYIPEFELCFHEHVQAMLQRIPSLGATTVRRCMQLMLAIKTWWSLREITTPSARHSSTIQYSYSSTMCCSAVQRYPLPHTPRLRPGVPQPLLCLWHCMSAVEVAYGRQSAAVIAQGIHLAGALGRECQMWQLGM